VHGQSFKGAKRLHSLQQGYELRYGLF
jgi:hypothetical protein